MPVDESFSKSANSNLGSEHSSIFPCAVSYEVFECHNAYPVCIKKTQKEEPEPLFKIDD
jgi:hypothetical protein